MNHFCSFQDQRDILKTVGLIIGQTGQRVKEIFLKKLNCYFPVPCTQQLEHPTVSSENLFPSHVGIDAETLLHFVRENTCRRNDGVCCVINIVRKFRVLIVVDRKEAASLRKLNELVLNPNLVRPVRQWAP